MYNKNAWVKIDTDWICRLIVEEIGPKWLEKAYEKNGFFYPELNRKWEKVGESIGTLVSQFRLLYLFSQCYQLTKNDKYLEAVKNGLDFVLKYFWDEEYGSWFWSCNNKGELVDKTDYFGTEISGKDRSCYGHAFVLFGLSHAYQVTGDRRIPGVLKKTIRTLHTEFKDKEGGLADVLSRDFVIKCSYRTQNPLMHLTEALLTISEITEQSQLKNAEYWINFLFEPLKQRGDKALFEFYNDEWEPDSKGIIYVGHQFEWAFLLSWAVKLGMSDSYLELGYKLINSGLELGLDNKYNGILRAVSNRGEIINDEKGYWEHTEAIRALATYIIRHNHKEFIEPLQKIISYFKNNFIDHEYRGIYPHLYRNGSVKDNKKGGKWKLDYHPAVMCREIKNIQKEINKYDIKR